MRRSEEEEEEEEEDMLYEQKTEQSRSDHSQVEEQLSDEKKAVEELEEKSGGGEYELREERSSAHDDKKLCFQEVKNQQHDAEVDLDGTSSDESIQTNETKSPKMKSSSKIYCDGDNGQGNANVYDNALKGIQEDSELSLKPEFVPGFPEAEKPLKQLQAQHQPQLFPKFSLDEVSSVSRNSTLTKLRKDLSPQLSPSTLSADKSEEALQSTYLPEERAARSTLYDPEQYAHLQVPSEVVEVFQYITRYRPHNIDLETELKCFLPDYVPAVGEMDSFVKIPPPNVDQLEDMEETLGLGLKVLDEPKTCQSDPTMLQLQLKSSAKTSHRYQVTVPSIEHASRNKHLVENWIRSVTDLHKSQPAQKVHYKGNMPDLERLLQVWPSELEDALKTGSTGNRPSFRVPAAELDLSITDYARIALALCDIPVHHHGQSGKDDDGIIQALHVLFTLYSEFKKNEHFRNEEEALGV